MSFTFEVVVFDFQKCDFDITILRSSSIINDIISRDQMDAGMVLLVSSIIEYINVSSSLMTHCNHCVCGFFNTKATFMTRTVHELQTVYYKL